MDSRIITAKQSETLHLLLSDMMIESEADSVFVCDCGGNIIGHVSQKENDKNQTIAALASGSFAATGELASIIGEPTFRSIFHKGDCASIYMQNLGSNFLMLVIFGKRTTIGLVKLYIEKASGKIEAFLRKLDGQTMESSGTKVSFSIDPSAKVFERKSDESP